MEGKGWFVIYGVLLILLVTSFVMIAGMNSRLTALERKAEASPVAQAPQPEETPEPSGTPGPDLSSPEARDNVRKADLKSTKDALTKYRQERGTYPKELKELVDQFLPVVPADPLAPKYTYRYQKTATGFRITCYLENPNDPDDTRDGKRDRTYTVTEKTP